MPATKCRSEIEHSHEDLTLKGGEKKKKNHHEDLADVLEGGEKRGTLNFNEKRGEKNRSSHRGPMGRNRRCHLRTGEKSVPIITFKEGRGGTSSLRYSNRRKKKKEQGPDSTVLRQRRCRPPKEGTFLPCGRVAVLSG